MPTNSFERKIDPSVQILDESPKEDYRFAAIIDDQNYEDLIAKRCELKSLIKFHTDEVKVIDSHLIKYHEHGPVIKGKCGYSKITTRKIKKYDLGRFKAEKKYIFEQYQKNVENYAYYDVSESLSAHLF